MSWLICPHDSKLCNGTYYSLHGSCNYAPTLSVVYCYSPQQMQHNQCSTTNAATMQYYAILHQVSQAERMEDFLLCISSTQKGADHGDLHQQTQCDKSTPFGRKQVVTQCSTTKAATIQCYATLHVSQAERMQDFWLA